MGSTIISSTEEVELGETVQFQPKSGGQFPTGESTRRAKVESIQEDTVILRQTEDGFIKRVEPSQILK